MQGGEIGAIAGARLDLEDRLAVGFCIDEEIGDPVDPAVGALLRAPVGFCARLMDFSVLGSRISFELKVKT